ncbi:hypothetical protein B5E77_04405 [Lachnoclostridium sp. An131]|nr:hypothetical protein B5E77_04405 [Lachnoclostridium sp. An131]
MHTSRFLFFPAVKEALAALPHRGFSSDLIIKFFQGFVNSRSPIPKNFACEQTKFLLSGHILAIDTL